MGAEDIGLYIAYTAFFVAIGAAVVLPLLSSLKQPKVLIQSLLGVGVLAALFIVCYFIADAEVTPAAKAYGVTPSSAKLVGAGLYTFYIVFVVSLVGMVYSEITNALK